MCFRLPRSAAGPTVQAEYPPRGCIETAHADGVTPSTSLLEFISMSLVACQNIRMATKQPDLGQRKMFANTNPVV